MENPSEVEFSADVPIEVLYEVLADHLDKEHYKKVLYKIYEKAASIEMERKGLREKHAKAHEEIKDLRGLLKEWRTGESNILLSLDPEDINNILDIAFVMVQEESMDVFHVSRGQERLEKTLDLHPSACGAISSFLDRIIRFLKGQTIPGRDEVYLDTENLSEEELEKLVEVSKEGGEMEIPRNSVRVNTEDVSIEGNQILLDFEKLGPREKEVIRRQVDERDPMSGSVTIPSRAIVKMGDRVDQQNIRTLPAFPEENPDRDVEEAEEEMYGEGDETANEGDPNDQLPFKE